jgi:hypothetical protein
MFIYVVFVEVPAKRPTLRPAEAAGRTTQAGGRTIVCMYRRQSLYTYTYCRRVTRRFCPEAEFLDVIGTKVLIVFLLAIHSHPP